MKKYFAGFAFFILLAIPCVAQQAAAWKEYSYKDDLIAFSMPGEPQTITKMVDTGTVKFPIHLYALVANGYSLLVGGQRLPPPVKLPKPPLHR